MKLLLDESVPRRLATSFPDSYTLYTVQEMGWTGFENGALLALAAQQNFDAFVTVDRGIAYQQNMNDLPISVVIMLASRNRLAELQLLVPRVVEVLSGELQKSIYRVPE